jgi:hypothetical protein
MTQTDLDILWIEANRLWRSMGRRGTAEDSHDQIAVEYRTTMEALRAKIAETPADVLDRESGKVVLCRKVPYETQAQAKLSARQLRSRLGRNLSPYRCKECPNWHLTTTTKKELKSRRRQWKERVRGLVQEEARH